MKRIKQIPKLWPVPVLAIFFLAYALAQTYVVQTNVTDSKGNVVATATTQFSAASSASPPPAASQGSAAPTSPPPPTPPIAAQAHGLTLPANLPARPGVVYQTTVWMQAQQYDLLGFVVPNIPANASIISTATTPGHLASDFSDFGSAIAAAIKNGSWTILFRDGGIYTNNQNGNGCMNQNLYIRGGTLNHPVLVTRIGRNGWADRSLPQPVLLQGFGIGGRNLVDGTNGPSSYVMVLDLDFYGDVRDPASPTFNQALATNGYYQSCALTTSDTGTGTPSANFWFEGCRFHFMMSGISILGGFTTPVNTVVVRGCVFDHCYGDHFGLYDFNTVDFLVADCTFDHNGWNETVAPKNDTLGRNHDIYFGVNPVVVTKDPLHRVFNTTLARAGAEGIEANSGGDLDTILFGVNPIAGYTGGGYVGNINNFVVDGGGGLYDQGTPDSALSICPGNAGSFRGWGVFLDCATSGSITNGVICNKPEQQNNGFAYGVHTIDSAKGLPTETTTATLSNLTVDRWFEWSGNTTSAPNQLNVSQQGPPIPVVTYLNDIFPGVTSIQGVNGVSPAYVDPTRSIATYAQSLGIAGVTDGPSFFAAQCKQNGASWDDRLTAAAAVNWIRAGFAVK